LAEAIEELRALEPGLASQIEQQRNSASVVVEELPRRWKPSDVGRPGPSQRAWELAGLCFLEQGRIHEALSVFWGLYQHMLAAQSSVRVHKGMPLYWISHCFQQLGFRVLAKRYLMLTLCEDALSGQGLVSPDDTGAYFGLPHAPRPQ
jgi:hypothetical protein